MDILLGADPELFLKKGPDFYSGHGVIPGTKEQPYRVRKGAVQVDGMALEFNIDPAKTEQEFKTNIKTVMKQLRKMVPKDLDFEITPTANFKESVLKSQPPEALELGCDPDYNAYTRRMNNPPQIPVSKKGLRTAAGHIHIGWTKDINPTEMTHFESCVDLVRQLDWFLGVPSRLIDDNQERRTLYGQFGAFRPKSYGCEYRVLSNWWLKSPQYIEWVYKTTHAAIQALLDGKVYSDVYGGPWAYGKEHSKNIIRQSKKFKKSGSEAGEWALPDPPEKVGD